MTVSPRRPIEFNYAVAFACHNQVDYTRKYVDSLVTHGIDLTRCVAVDNASTDETRAYLKTLNLGACILNRANLGCGVAWNQGARALQAEWTVVMNNDVLVSANWLENLLLTANRAGLKIISPSLIEGPLDYDWDRFSNEASAKMHDALRLGEAHAICMAVHESIWHDIGYFQPVPKLRGFEDTLFFHQVDKARLPIGRTGSSWLHHFGSMTLKYMRQQRGLSEKGNLGDRKSKRLLRLSWLGRKLQKARKRRRSRLWRKAELARYGMTMHGVRDGGQFTWN